MNTDIKDFKNALKNGVVYFEYVKKDGTIREAKGTTNESLIPESDIPKGESTRKYTPNDNVTKYYDLEKNGWRSFNSNSFRSFSLDD